MKLLVIGMGLIGGSLCKAFKKYTDFTVGGYDLNPHITKKALRQQAIDTVASADDFADFDIVAVCLYPTDAAEFVKKHIQSFKKGAILTDVCGVKGNMVEELTALALEHGMDYVSTHPMAGKEKFGYNFSDGELFQGANFIITPIKQTSRHAINTIETLAFEIGFRSFVSPSPQEHDRIIAYTSQLAHVVSSAYVKSPTMLSENGFSGGSFQDMTRIATMNEKMWATLFLLNREVLLSELDTLIENLSLYKKCLVENDKDELEFLIAEGRELKERNLLISKK